MSFAIPYLFKNGAKKRRDYNARQPPQSAAQADSSSSISSDSDSREQSYPTLVAMTQARGGVSQNPSPTSSITSRSRPTSIGPHLTTPLEPEELENNRFYRYNRMHFNLIFSRSSVVCVPHSRSLEGLILTKDFIETHSYNPSPYYQGQYQAANGKVISIELPIISTMSGFKEPRIVYVMAEEWVYIKRKKIRVFMIERALEGDPLPPQPRSPNTLSIPTVRNSKTDLDFLNMLPENAEAMIELQLGIQKFVNTYVYIRGFNAYTVDKIQHMYAKAYMTILQKNSRLREACLVQSEHDHLLELVENVVMGFLYDKIWVQSLRTILQSQDSYLDSICSAYARESITLNRYAVSHPMCDMDLGSFQAAIACLRRVDTETEPPISVDDDRPAAPVLQNTAGDQLAFTPLEKLACVRMTLDLITTAVSDYIHSTSVNAIDDDDSPVTADEMIPLFAYILVHSRITRIASLAFYMEHFRLSHIERSEHSFALVTLKAAADFLKADPLSLLDASSEKSNVSTSSTPSSALSPKLQNIRARSTSFSSPISSPQINAAVTQGSVHYRSVSMSSSSVGTTKLRHRKSHSADLQNMAEEQQTIERNTHGSSNSSHSSHHHHAHHHSLNHGYHYYGATSSNCNSGSNNGGNSNSNNNINHNNNTLLRRNSLTPSVIIRPIVAQPSSISLASSPNRRSLEISHDWMIGKQQQHTNNNAPKTPAISHSRPIVSTTFPTISNSSPLPGFNQKLLSPETVTPPAATTQETRKLARSLSSTSSLYAKKSHNNSPPEIINIRQKGRPASICIDPRSMHQPHLDNDDDDEQDDGLGDFLLGLRGVDGDIVGERSGSYRTVRRL